MQDIPKVWRTEASSTLLLNRPLNCAIIIAIIAPIAELSTKLVHPLMKGITMVAKIPSGNRPARNKANFSGNGTLF